MDISIHFVFNTLRGRWPCHYVHFVMPIVVGQLHKTAPSRCFIQLNRIQCKVYTYTQAHEEIRFDFRDSVLKSLSLVSFVPLFPWEIQRYFTHTLYMYVCSTRKWRTINQPVFISPHNLQFSNCDHRNSQPFNYFCCYCCCCCCCCLEWESEKW